MSVALCAPQSSRFSSNFALRKLFASGNWYCLWTNIFIRVHHTFKRNAWVKHRRGDSIGSLFLYFSPFYSEIWSHRYVIKSQFNKLISPAEQGLIPSQNFIREQRLGVILKGHSLAQINKKPNASLPVHLSPCRLQTSHNKDLLWLQNSN